MFPELEIEIEVHDKDGKPIEPKKTFKAHSWLRQFVVMLKGYFATRFDSLTGHGNTTLTDETGTGRGFPAHYAWYDFRTQPSTFGDAGDSAQGIVVGSSDTANTITTYALGSKISHGTGSGQLYYSAMAYEEVSNPGGSDLQFRMTRTFTNNSGATVTVKEVGLCIQTFDTSQVGRSFLIARDVLPSPSSIPDGATMTVRYVVKITVS